MATRTSQADFRYQDPCAVNRQRILSHLRGLGLLPALEAARFVKCRWDSRSRNAAFLREHPGFAPPPLWWMHDMYSHTDFAIYHETGRNAADAIASLIRGHHAGVVRDVAEWGCGLARVLRHIPSDWNRTGFDINDVALEWCRKNLPGIGFTANGLVPPLASPPESFDAIYALSVFTHLSETVGRLWIEELFRVLRPGGVLICTFHGARQTGSLLPEELRALEAGRIVVRGQVREGRRFFAAYHSQPYLENVLFAGKQVVCPPQQAFGQELWVLRKGPQDHDPSVTDAPRSGLANRGAT